MIIAHISDIHGDIETLETFLDRVTDFDVLAVTGDLAPNCMTLEDAQRMSYGYQTLLNHDPNSVIKKGLDALEAESGNPDEKYPQSLAIARGIEIVADEWCRTPVKDDDPNKAVVKALNACANNYLYFSRKFQSESLEALSQIRDLLKKAKKAFVVPGNHEPKSFFELFKELSLHEGYKAAEGIEFAGYGGSPYVPIAIPVKDQWKEPFDEKSQYHHLMEKNPQVALTHIPPYGLSDSPSGNPEHHEGSFPLLAYLRAKKPKLLLCGHFHLGRCIMNDGEYSQTVVVNPGNLGKHVNEFQDNSGEFHQRIDPPGNYALMEMDENSARVKRVELHNLFSSPTLEAYYEPRV